MVKTIKCKVCNNEIAKDAKVCPHCGKKRNFFVRHKILTIFLALIILGAIGSATGGKEKSSLTTSSSNKTTTVADNSTENKNTENQSNDDSTPTPTPTPVPVIEVTAQELLDAYEANEVKADKSYKDQLVNITGIVDNIGVSLGQTYVVLNDGSDFAITGVQCFFKDDAEIDKVAELNKGDEVTIQGVIDGYSLNVLVKKCKIID